MHSVTTSEGILRLGFGARRFVLASTERKLLYFKKEGDKKAQGFIALDNATVDAAPSPQNGEAAICIKTSAAFDQDKQ